MTCIAREKGLVLEPAGIFMPLSEGGATLDCTNGFFFHKKVCA